MPDDPKSQIIDLGTTFNQRNKPDFEVGIYKHDLRKVILVLAQEAKNIAMSPDIALKLGQALIQMAREVQKRSRVPIIRSPGNG